ncbi:MAG: hypothetical protein U1E63_01945 [Burkholderiales bacterium]
MLGPADYLPAGSDPAHQGLAAQGEVNLRLALDTGSMHVQKAIGCFSSTRRRRHSAGRSGQARYNRVLRHPLHPYTEQP